MSLAYRKYVSGTEYTIQMVNSFDLNMETCRRSFKCTEEIAQDRFALEEMIFQYAVEVMNMKPDAIVIWECKDLGD